MNLQHDPNQQYNPDCKELMTMKILVACEESQAVTIELRELGHEAYSCDIEPCSGGHPEWHLQQDVMPLLKEQWDMILAFPPCTHLCSAGQHWFSRGIKDSKLRDDAVDFFMAFVNVDCDRVAIENPVGIMSTKYRKPDQKIHPWQFGHPMSKTTCLWLKGIPPLQYTEVLKKPETGWMNQHYTNGKYTGFVNKDENGKVMAWNNPDTSKIRSKTFPGIAKAMAEQWAGRCE